MTQTRGTAATEHPPLWGRRTVARLIDAALALVLSAVVVWPSAWSSALDALTAAGFDSARDFLDAWDADAAADGAAGRAAEALQPVVFGAVLLQTVVIWLYETLSTILTGTTPGKSLNRLRLHVDQGDDPMPSMDTGRRRSWGARVVRMGLRAALVIVPPALAAGMVLAGFLGVAGASGVAEVSIAVSLVMAVLTFVSSAGLHGLLTGTRVVGFRWAELRQQAEQYAADQAHLDRLREAADQSTGAGRARERIEADPRYAPARQGVNQASQAASQARAMRGRSPQELLEQGRRALEARGVQVSDDRAQQFSQAVDSFLSKTRRRS